MDMSCFPLLKQVWACVRGNVNSNQPMLLRLSWERILVCNMLSGRVYHDVEIILIAFVVQLGHAISVTKGLIDLPFIRRAARGTAFAGLVLKLQGHLQHIVCLDKDTTNCCQHESLGPLRNYCCLAASEVLSFLGMIMAFAGQLSLPCLAYSQAVT